jgi:hypothetical protein
VLLTVISSGGIKHYFIPAADKVFDMNIHVISELTEILSLLVVIILLGYLIVYVLRPLRAEQINSHSWLLNAVRELSRKISGTGNEKEYAPQSGEDQMRGVAVIAKSGGTPQKSVEPLTPLTNDKGIKDLIDKASAVQNQLLDSLVRIADLTAKNQEEVMSTLSTSVAEFHKAAAALTYAFSGLTVVLRNMQLESGVEKRAEIQPARAQEDNRPGASRDPSTRFDDLTNWLRSNLQAFLKKIVINRYHIDALLNEIPRQLLATIEFLDGRVLLLGTENCNKYLAIAIPGSYIGTRYFGWFSMTKGTNERIEGTVDPAIVEKAGEKFEVVQQGKVSQN